jgi:hypothetical protein
MMKLLRMITKNLHLALIVLAFAIAGISVSNNFEKKSHISLSRLEQFQSKISTSSSFRKLAVKKKETKKIIKKTSTKLVLKKEVKNKIRNKVKLVENKIVLKKEKVSTAKKDSRELSHKEIVKLYAFNVEKPKSINWVAVFNDYSSRVAKRTLIADTVKTKLSKPIRRKRIESVLVNKKKEVKRKEIALRDLYSIPKLSDLNLGFKTYSVQQVIEEYKHDLAMEKKKASNEVKLQKKKRIARAVTLVPPKKVSNQKRAIKKIKNDKKEISRKIKRRMKKERKEKVASVTGSVRRLEKESLSKLTTQISGNKVSTQAVEDPVKTLNNQTLTTTQNINKEVQTVDYFPRKIVKKEAPAPRVIDVKDMIAEVREEFKQYENVEETSEEKEVDVVTEYNAINDSQEVYEEESVELDELINVEEMRKDIEQKVAITNEPEEVIEESLEEDLVDTQVEEKVETEEIKGTEQLDNIISEMNQKFENDSTENKVDGSQALAAVSNEVSRAPEGKVDEPLKLVPKKEDNKIVTTPVVTQAQAQAQIINRDGLSKKELNNIMNNIGANNKKQLEQTLKTLQSSTDKPKKISRISYKKRKPVRSSLKINVDSIELNKRITKKQSNFDIRFNDDINEVYSDHGTGSVILKTKLNIPMSVRAANIVLRGHLPTNVDFVFEDDAFEVDVPLIESYSIEKLMSNKGLTGRGGFILVQLDSAQVTDKVEIDAAFEGKLYLDSKFRDVDPGNSDYAYIMFAGVNPGNTLLTYTTKDREIASKIVFVSESEIYFDTNEYIRKTIDSFELYENHLLGQENVELMIPNDAINILASNKTTKKLSINKYQYQNLIFPLGTRQYSELRHLNDSIYLGRWNNEVVELPSEDYMNFVLNKFKLQRIGSQCVVQVNFSKNVNSYQVTGRSKRGYMRVDSQVLDVDGQLYEEMSEKTKKLFLVGEEQGIINLKISYLDGSFDYLQTYCSEDTYLVEQL